MINIRLLKRQRMKLREWPRQFPDALKHVLYLICSDYVFYCVRSEWALARFGKAMGRKRDEVPLIDRRDYVDFEKYEQAMAYGQVVSPKEEQELNLLLRRGISPWEVRLLVKSGWCDSTKSKKETYAKERLLAVFGGIACLFVLSIFTSYGYQIFYSGLPVIEKLFLSLFVLSLLMLCILVWGYQLIGPFLAILQARKGANH